MQLENVPSKSICISIFIAGRLLTFGVCWENNEEHKVYLCSAGE